MQPVIGLLAALVVFAVSCSSGEETTRDATDGSGSSSDPVAVVRIRQGERVDGQCRFGEDISQYPVTYSAYSEDCLQAVRIGPLGRGELDQMKQDLPLFWENSSPYQQVLVGEWIDGECEFTSPGVRAFLDVSEIVSADQTSCQMIVEMRPVTQKQIEEINRLGGESATAVPAPPVAVPGR